MRASDLSAAVTELIGRAPEYLREFAASNGVPPPGLATWAAAQCVGLAGLVRFNPEHVATELERLGDAIRALA